MTTIIIKSWSKDMMSKSFTKPFYDFISHCLQGKIMLCCMYMYIRFYIQHLQQDLALTQRCIHKHIRAFITVENLMENCIYWFCVFYKTTPLFLQMHNIELDVQYVKYQKHTYGAWVLVLQACMCLFITTSVWKLISLALCVKMADFSFDLWPHRKFLMKEVELDWIYHLPLEWCAFLYNRKLNLHFLSYVVVNLIFNYKLSFPDPLPFSFCPSVFLFLFFRWRWWS